MLAEAPRSEIPTLDVVRAPTPELDALFEGMREHMPSRDDPGDDEREQSYAAPDIDHSPPHSPRAPPHSSPRALRRGRRWDGLRETEDARGRPGSCRGARHEAHPSL